MNLIILFLCAVGVFSFHYLTSKNKLLTTYGASAAIGIGMSVIVMAGIEWLIPLFFFFGSSVLIGKNFKTKSNKSDKKHGKPRDKFQVISNGLPYAVSSFFFIVAPDISALMMGVSMATATADTWSSEIGIYFKGKTYDIFKMRPVAAGVSGGMSLSGTVAGLIGSALVAVICSYIFFERFNPMYFNVVAVFGFVGMCLDSFLGSFFQIKYSKEGILSDSKNSGFNYHSGLKWMTNDMVNLWSNALMVLFAGLFFISMT